MSHSENPALLADLKKAFAKLPEAVRQQIVEALHELRKEIESAERKPVMRPNRSTESWFARA
jgi:phage-related protein